MIHVGSRTLEPYDGGWVSKRRRVKGQDSKNAGEVYYSEAKYYPTLEVACDRLLDLAIQEGAEGVTELEEIRGVIQDAKREVSDLINQIKASK